MQSTVAMMPGWRGRLGFMVPSPGIASSEEMRELCPTGVLSVFATTPIASATIEGNREALAHIELGIGQLARAAVDAIVHVGAIPSIVLGPGHDDEILRRAGAVTDIPVILSMRATVDALHHLGVSSVAAVNPLGDELIALATAYLEAHGIRALSCPVLGLTSPIAVHELPAGVPYRYARQALRQAPEADAILLLGGGWRTLDVIGALESDTGKPTLSTNTAAMWAVMKRMGVREARRGYGRLLED